ncbi:MAG: hypothetical protein AVDCRST_MAG33-2483, partial [uncultured Thermomicrobiales bacterium]
EDRRVPYGRAGPGGGPGGSR